MGRFKFRRQHPFADYILDFVCIEAKLVIEVDGSQHADQQDYDERRTAVLEQAGFSVLRFWNNDVLLNTEAVCEQIYTVLQSAALDKTTE